MFHLPGNSAVQFICELSFRKNISPRQILPSHLLLAGSLIGWFFTLKMEVIRYSERSLHIRTTWRYIPDDGNIHSYRHENLRSYKNLEASWYRQNTKFLSVLN
jgi:hypothetical protein